MLKVKMYNSKGEATGDLELNDKVFGVNWKAAAVHQAYQALLANARQPWADTKDKSEVRGGGKKPWQQKGTGRARHGSIRSPLWVGGGVTFGPLSTRNYKQKLNKTMNHSAVRMLLSAKVAKGELVVLEDLNADTKTKPFATLRKALPGAGKTTLWLSEKADKKLYIVLKNLHDSKLQIASDVNVVDLAHYQYLITTKAGIKVLEKRLS